MTRLRRFCPGAPITETGVIVYSPMQSGLLTGSFDTARAESLAPDDWRRGRRTLAVRRCGAI